jgi:hypothetical protein
LSEILLHIGLNKTGTSSIQDFLSMNAVALANEGFCYPKAGRDASAHHLLSHTLKALPFTEDAAQHPLVQALRDEIAPFPRVLLSSEDFHTHGNRSVERLGQLLSGHKVRVLLYVREHLSYLASWYQQNVQATHQSCAFDHFCYFTRKPLFAIADRWAKVFGHRNIALRLYDRATLAGGDVVLDLAEQAGIGGNLARFARKPYESNPSVAGNLLFAKRLINNFHTKAQAASFVDQITALSKLRPEFRGKMLIDADTAAWVAGMYQGDRQKLKDRYGVFIAPHTGVHAGHATPDFTTLRQDWELIMQTARDAQMPIAEAARYINVGDCAGLAVPS